ncbi:hypothetical protein [Streptomyces lavendulae]|uniref:hypothetical protein n=1 Tax=Streptomyces lavendulae TaxID=1914 RepID=UPI0031F14C71
MNAVLDRLDGLPRQDLEGRLFNLWRVTMTERNLAEVEVQLWHGLAAALVHLRRTDLDTFRALGYRQKVKADATRLVPGEVVSVKRMAWPVGKRVRILGEAAPGIVTHVLTEWETVDMCAVNWFVVAAPARRVCRAHGSDEVEGLDPES